MFRIILFISKTQRTVSSHEENEFILVLHIARICRYIIVLVILIIISFLTR
ncbi:hypothetical protein H9L01_03825 [Erysipelothrix inopinata]|uniref:Uncharacterized protein n=1 Tax=Erysipelothrix inopinata TaxID=225084 RepID=A0A7G9S0X5_9FIRM|nr:hypothetical protein [Erysipelothrix inopinata]QNN61500.1 hypothetical protein H9L01_03825 [Erysipelothrix inopinata]